MTTNPLGRWDFLSKSPSTVRAYYCSIGRFLESACKDISQVNEADVTNYLYSLRSRCSDRSLARHAYAIKSFSEFAGKNDLASKVPPPSSRRSPEPKWLTEDHVKSIIKHATTLRDTAMLQTAYDLALRVEEVCLLDRSVQL